MAAGAWEVLSLLALLVLYWCFTGTKVQILTLHARCRSSEVLSLLVLYWCFTGDLLVIYWYKSTNTDTARAL